ncbi:MAG: hypothetical protein OXQ96_02885, partial [Alphaproteobacteria bacterium]|nr:hypothetical protein [Alphaproteobacteria bacterium]
MSKNPLHKSNNSLERAEHTKFIHINSSIALFSCIDLGYTQLLRFNFNFEKSEKFTKASLRKGYSAMDTVMD